MADDTQQQAIPVQSGVGLAAVILGAVVVVLSVVVGLCSLTVELPVFGAWWLLPVVVAAIGLGMFSARTSFGVAGAALGVVALLVCLLFVLVDREYGAEIRRQLRPGNAVPAGVNLEQIIKSMPTTRGTP